MTNQTPSNSVVTEAMIEAGLDYIRSRGGSLSAISLRDLYFAMQSANTTGSDELDPGDPQDWADKLEELYGWTGSTWAEEQPEAYSFMCSLIGYLIAGYELALRVNAIATPDTELRREYEALQHDFDRRAAAENERLNENMTLTDRVAVLTEALLLAKTALGFPTGKIMRPEAEARRAAFEAIDAALSQ